MKYIFFVILLALSSVILFFGIMALKADEKYSRSVSFLLINGFITVLVYAISIIIMNKLFNKIFITFYFISIDWLLYFVINFLFDYSDSRKIIKKAQRIDKINMGLRIIAYADSTSLLLNLFLNHAFDNVLYYNAITTTYYWANRYLIGYQFHLFFCYFLVLFITLEFIREILANKNFKRKSLIIILAGFLVIIGVDVLFVTRTLMYDYSVVLYGVITVVIYYSTIIYRKRNFLNTMTELYADNIYSAVFCFDSERECIFTNANASKLFPTQEQIDFISKEYLKSPWLQPAIINKSDYATGNDSFIVNNEQKFFSIEYQLLKDKKNKIFGSYLKFTDITTNVIKKNLEKNHLSHDPLTGLLKAEAFVRKAEEIIHSNQTVTRYLVVTNIKDFRFINDIFGSELGDKILIEQASFFKYMKYRDCIIGRITADRFAILINKEDFNEKLALSNSEMLQNLTKSLNYTIKVKIGVYEIKPGEDDVLNMYDKATIAIDTIKDNHQTEIKYYNQSEMDKLIWDKTLINDFNNSMDNGDFEVVFQPVYNKNNEIVSYEALSRWKKNNQLLQPDSFIPVLEKSIFIGKLDEFVLEETCKFIKENYENNNNIFVSVNIIEMDFYYFNVYKKINELIKKYAIPTNSIGLEIPEKILEKKEYLEVIEELKREGILIILDNFGTGYSSFSTFNYINPDYIKIKINSFDLENDKEKSMMILNSVMHISNTIDTRIIVKYIETEEELSMLKECGFDLFQGSFLSIPKKRSDL